MLELPERTGRPVFIVLWSIARKYVYPSVYILLSMSEDIIARRWLCTSYFVPRYKPVYAALKCGRRDRLVLCFFNRHDQVICHTYDELPNDEDFLWLNHQITLSCYIVQLVLRSYSGVTRLPTVRGL